jgi:predicted ArsR family transcriptional regulator
VPELQEQARALGDPTRYAIFRLISEAGGSADVATLTGELGLNHNAVRQHLAKLLAAELVDESKAPARGRGRPRLVYRVNPSADGRWGVVGPYERLSVLLAEVVRSGDSPEEVGRRHARTGRGTNVPVGDDPVALVLDEMARQGFDPVVRRRGARTDIVLQTCPFASAALTDPDTVCSIHLGIAEGVADATGGQIVVDELVPHDPRRANCRLRLHEEPPERGR